MLVIGILWWSVGIKYFVGLCGCTVFGCGVWAFGICWWCVGIRYLVLVCGHQVFGVVCGYSVFGVWCGVWLLDF